MHRRALLQTGLLAWALPARAATISGVSLPDSYPLAGQTLVLNGIGIRTVTILSVRAYVAALYLPQRNKNAAAILASKEPKVLLMQFLHSASKSQVERQYREGEEKNCGHGECPQADQADFERLVTVTPAASVGDTLTYIYTDKGVRVLSNNRQIADIPNPDLAVRLLMGFIGPTPPSEDLKSHLLGLKEG